MAQWKDPGNIRIEFNGVDKTGRISANLTKGWDNFYTKYISGIALEKGRTGNESDRIGCRGNDLNHFRFVKADYKKRAHTIPGIIQAEDYNEGGEGVGYHDTTPFKNEGGGYRNDGVDIKARGKATDDSSYTVDGFLQVNG